MDVERTIEFILEQQAKVEANLASITERLDRAAERADRADERADNADKRMDRMDAYMRHAVRLVIREARNERQRRREMDARWDQKMTQLASSQLLTEESVRNLSNKVDALSNKMDAFVDSMRRGNGHPPA